MNDRVPSSSSQRGDHHSQSQYDQRLAVNGRSHDSPNRFVLGPAATNDLARQNMSSQSTNNNNPTQAVQNNETRYTSLEHLSNDMANLLNQTDISDCYLNVRGTYMAVHKCILAARSRTFFAIISNKINRRGQPGDDTNNGNDNKTTGSSNKINGHDNTANEKGEKKMLITIDKTDPEIMKQVIIFLYTGKCDLNEGNAYELLDAAGRYDIKDLKVHTGRFLADRIKTNNVLSLLKAAYKYDNALVRHRCIEFFVNNAQEIMDHCESWKIFAEENKEIVAELLYNMVHKEEFYRNKPNWDTNSYW